ncbi:MAG: M23 family metallopeptidase [Spirochaetales bacterium]|nr:M23 family metallopeptidase [Spirochaetales bacterium]
MKFLSAFTNRFNFINKRAKSFFKIIKSIFTQHFTIMLIPHSEKKAINFKISFFGILFMTFLSVASITGLTIAVVFATNANQKNIELATTVAEANNKINTIETAMNSIHQQAVNTSRIKNQHLAEMGINNNRSDITENDDTASMSLEYYPSDQLKQSYYADYTKKLLEDMSNDYKVFANLLKKEKEILQKLPTIWPVERGIGRITNRFGPQPDPFNRQGWYLHKGLDIADRRHVGVLAAADGKIIEQGFDNVFGNSILIRHNYEFYTKYAHLHIAYVKAGDTVKQGQLIGLMGNTGMSTGNHLHYEIRIGAEVVDPEGFLFTNK